MTRRYIYIFLIFLVSCNSHSDYNKHKSFFGHKISFVSPDLSINFTSIIKTLDNETHGVSFIDTKGDVILKDTLVAIFNRLSKFRNVNEVNYETFIKTCNNVDFFTWKAKTHELIMTRLEKVSFKTTVFFNGNQKNEINITDFDFYFIQKPNHVAVRIVSDYDLEYLVIDNNKYKRISESILVGIEKAVAQLDSIKANPCR